jgi:hypothetical protein
MANRMSFFRVFRFNHARRLMTVMTRPSTRLRDGGPRPIKTGGVIQPWRNASDSKGLRVASGGPSHLEFKFVAL